MERTIDHVWICCFTGLREGREAILHKMADRIIHRGPIWKGIT